MFQITVNYDRYQTEGLTADDIIESVSAAYGAACVRLLSKGEERSYAISEDVVARWEDGEYRLDLIRARYGPVFRLVATQKRLGIEQSKPPYWRPVGLTTRKLLSARPSVPTASNPNGPGSNKSDS